MDTTSKAEIPKAAELMTVADINELYGLGRTKTYERLRSGEIPSFTIDGRRYVRRSEFEAWLEDHRVASPTK